MGRTGKFLSSLCFALVTCASSTGWTAEPATAEIHALEPGGFQFLSKGNFTGRKDRRNLLLVDHPLAESQAGDFGSFRYEVTLPSEAKPPYLLCFYATDNNTPAKADKGYMMVDQRVGHRFKEIRINGETVWSEDTNLQDNWKWRVVDITSKIPDSRSFTLEAGLFEKVNSSEVLPGDVVKSPPQKAFRPRQEVHQTESYWGDFTIVSGGAVQTVLPAPRWNPNLVSARLAQVASEPWTAEGITLENVDLIRSGWPWPVVTGIPFPEGKFPGDTNLSMVSGNLTGTVRPLSFWPDGSIKWGLAQAVIPVDFEGEFQIRKSESAGVLTSPVQIEKSGQSRLKITNGQIEVEVKSDGGELDLKILAGDQVIASGLAFYFEGESQSFGTAWGSPRLIEEHPERVTLEVEGNVASKSGERYGRCRLQLTVFAEVPYVRLLTTIYNETPVDPFRAKAFGWKLTLPGESEGKTGEASFTVPTGSHFLTGAIRYFRQIGPNAIRLDPRQVDLQFFQTGDPVTPFYQTHPGEAKTHEVWLAVSQGEVSAAAANRFALLVDRPPGFAVAPLIRASGVWGAMPKIDPETDAILYQNLVESAAEAYFANVKTGIRAFGNYPGFASSFYWNSLHSMYSLYAMTGERKWLDRAERSVRHLMDLLICHWSPDANSVGGMYSYYSTRTPDGNRVFEPDFSNADFSIRSQNPHAAFDHWQLTGSPDGKRIAIGIADFLLKNPEMKELAKNASARHQGWALIALARAYSETSDVRYRDYGRYLLRAAKDAIDPRRGAYLQTHSSVNHPGIVPFMVGILATGLRDFHEATGDPDALELLGVVVTAANEETIDKEWSTTNPGLSYHYSPNPHHRFERVPQLNIGLTGGNAYLAALSGDQNYARFALDGWTGFLKGCQKSANTSLYDLPQTLFWLKSLPGWKPTTTINEK